MSFLNLSLPLGSLGPLWFLVQLLGDQDMEPREGRTVSHFFVIFYPTPLPSSPRPPQLPSFPPSFHPPPPSALLFFLLFNLLFFLSFFFLCCTSSSESVSSPSSSCFAFYPSPFPQTLISSPAPSSFLIQREFSLKLPDDLLSIFSL